MPQAMRVLPRCFAALQREDDAGAADSFSSLSLPSSSCLCDHAAAAASHCSSRRLRRCCREAAQV